MYDYIIGSLPSQKDVFKRPYCWRKALDVIKRKETRKVCRKTFNRVKRMIEDVLNQTEVSRSEIGPPIKRNYKGNVDNTPPYGYIISLYPYDLNFDLQESFIVRSYSDNSQTYDHPHKC